MTREDGASALRVEKTYHHGDLRQALVRAALEILVEQGDPSALSLRETARRAGVSAMAPYRHFTDKDALLAAVAEIGFERLQTALAAADRQDDPDEALIRQGVAYVVFACENPALFRLMFGAAFAARRGTHVATGDSAYGVLARRVAAGVPSELAAAWTLRCWALVHGLASLVLDGQLSDRHESPAAMADRVLRLSRGVPGQISA